MEEQELKTKLESNISRDEKVDLIDNYFSTDENNNFKYLKFTDFNGVEHNFVGINKFSLPIDDIVAIKKYASYLYENYTDNELI